MKNFLFKKNTLKRDTQSRFAILPDVKVPRSTFDTSSSHTTTFGTDYLYPIYASEVLPGETVHLRAGTFTRFTNPLVVPVMDNLYLETQYFFVPTRLVWENWTKFCGERKNPNDSIDYLVPVANSGSEGVGVASLSDYLGIPPLVPNLEFSSLIHRAYYLIWNEWYRDQNLQDSLEFSIGDGPDDITAFTLQKRGKRKDYFTSALPEPQKGPAVEIPLGTIAPVFGNGMTLGLTNGEDNFGTFVGTVSGAPVSYFNKNIYGSNVGTSVGAGGGIDVSLSYGVTTDPTKSGLVADLSKSSAAFISDFYFANALQSFLVKDNMSGTRYTELLRSHFGVVSPDGRLQRPEYLGGSRCKFTIQAIPQTSATNDVTQQGNLAAVAGARDESAAFSYSSVEHGFIIGLASVRADLLYQQGLPRMFSRKTRYDFYWPEFNNLGEQAVLNKEIYAQGADVVDDDGNIVDEQVFGYQEHWSEYRFGYNRVSGLLRSVAPQSLDVWHYGQYFDSLPTLSAEFIEENVPIDRSMSVTSEPPFFGIFVFDVKADKPMGVYSIPGLMTRF